MPRNRNTFHPTVEALDDRCLLSIVSPRDPQLRNHFKALFPNRSVTSQVTEGAVARLTGTIVDADPHGTFVLQVDWNDGTATQVASFPAKPTIELSLTHVFQTVGQHTVHLIWRDKNRVLGFGPALSDDLIVHVTP
jgi:hypothetical protein